MEVPVEEQVVGPHRVGDQRRFSGELLDPAEVGVGRQGGWVRCPAGGEPVLRPRPPVAAVQPSEGVEAADLIKAAAKAVGGGGGGKGDIATAGGKDPGGLDEAMRIAAEAAGS